MTEDEEIKWMLEVHKKHQFGGMKPKWLGVVCDQIILDIKNAPDVIDVRAPYIKSRLQKFYNELVGEFR